MGKKATIVGGGLVGSLWSVNLAQRGYEVDVFEKRPDMRTGNVLGGRSINLAISKRGLTALAQVGMREQALELAIEMKGRFLHLEDGRTELQSYGGQEGETINSISRAGLNQLLLNEASKNPAVSMHFNQECGRMELDRKRIEFVDTKTGETRWHNYETMFATDGAFSGVRSALESSGVVETRLEPLTHAYKELVIPAGPKGTFLIEKNALHIWPRKSYMLIALPNLDGSFTVTLFLPEKGEDASFESLDSEAKVVEFFNTTFPDAVPYLDNLAKTFFENPTGSLTTVRANPWNYKNEIALMGDAAHAVVPFFGQGMNAGFEDCEVLAKMIDDSNGDVSLSNYTESRKENGDAIADMAIENYIEMRDHVADDAFRFRKEIDHYLERELKGKYRSKYGLVTFTQAPYRVAKDSGAIQKEILNELAQGITKPEEVDLRKAENLIEKKLGHLKAYL